MSLCIGRSGCPMPGTAIGTLSEWPAHQSKDSWAGPPDGILYGVPDSPEERCRLALKHMVLGVPLLTRYDSRVRAYHRHCRASSTMANGVLTVSDVEHIQLAVENGRPVHSYILGVREATLPAVLEYGCLRWAQPSLGLPELPPAVIGSELGRALNEVNSQLGSRMVGPDNKSWDRLDFRRYGFFVARDESQLDARDWKCFETLYNLSSGKVGLPKKVAGQLSVALHEMAANALTHARAPVPVLVGFHVRDGQSLFCVADVGIGVYESLRKHPSYSHIDTHADAIRCAARRGERGRPGPTRVRVPRGLQGPPVLRRGAPVSERGGLHPDERRRPRRGPGNGVVPPASPGVPGDRLLPPPDAQGPVSPQKAPPRLATGRTAPYT